MDLVWIEMVIFRACLKKLYFKFSRIKTSEMELTIYLSLHYHALEIDYIQSNSQKMLVIELEKQKDFYFNRLMSFIGMNDFFDKQNILKKE